MRGDMSSLLTNAESRITEEVRELVLSELPSLRLDRNTLEAALDSGDEARIPSRKGIVVVARVCNNLGVGPSREKVRSLTRPGRRPGKPDRSPRYKNRSDAGHDVITISRPTLSEAWIDTLGAVLNAGGCGVNVITSWHAVDEVVAVRAVLDEFIANRPKPSKAWSRWPAKPSPTPSLLRTFTRRIWALMRSLISPSCTWRDSRLPRSPHQAASTVTA